MADFRAARRLFVAIAAAIALAGSAAHAWGPVGHSQVGAIGDALLKGHPRAAAQVRAILGSVTLAQAGPWGDCIRSVTGPADGFRYQPLPQYRPPCLVFESPDMLASMIDYARNNWTNCSLPPQRRLPHPISFRRSGAAARPLSLRRRRHHRL